MQYFLVKTEVEDFSIEDQQNLKISNWTGVKNPQAINNLKKMKLNDLVLFYHTSKERAVVGLTSVHKEYYFQDSDLKYGLVDLLFIEKFPQKIHLSILKQDELLKNTSFIRQPRLSVSTFTKEEFDRILFYK
jgi:predicted RNA-binding protein with PUA-like domain